MTEEITKPNEIIVDKAVAIWKSVMIAPKYQNLRPGERHYEDDKLNLFAETLPYMLEKNSTDPILEKFGDALKIALMNDIPEYGYYSSSLNVDYSPTKLLSNAAEIAGLKTEFPYKTKMTVYADHLTWSYGYGSPLDYYYPLPDGRFLVTRLYGEDISKVIEYAMGGKPEFVIED